MIESGAFVSSNRQHEEEKKSTNDEESMRKYERCTGENQAAAVFSSVL